MGNDNADNPDKNTKPNAPRKRNYSDFFTWPPNRQLEEWAIVDALKESLEKANAGFFHSLIARGQGNDPPDCEAVLQDGGKLGIEVTELVDTEILMAHMNGNTERKAHWNKGKLIGALAKRLEVKNASNHIKGGPYELYMLVIHTDEPELNFDRSSQLLDGHVFRHLSLIQRAFLLMSYDQRHQCCPFLELKFAAETA